MAPWHLCCVFGFCALALLLAVASTAQAEPVRFAALAPSGDAANGIADSARELECMALNIYWEARSEPRLGQMAVAAVVLNRVADAEFPDTICDVVMQGGERGRHRCQFSWHCDGQSDVPRNPTAWESALSLARTVLGRHYDPSRGALWYHAEHVQPAWSLRMPVIAHVGHHLFYRDWPTD
jgi:spore germination cell wall hydrolase CwlJ-like protein